MRQSLKKISPVVEPLIPIFGSIRPTSKPGASASTTKAEMPEWPRLGIGLGEDDVEVRDAGVGDEALAAVEHVLVALAPRLGAHRGRVGARARLGERVGGQPLAARQAREVARLLLVGAGELDPERARAPARRGSGRSSRRPSTAPRSRRAPSARPCRCRRSAPRTAARAGRARASARPCPRGTRPSCRSRPRAARRARARASRTRSRISRCSSAERVARHRPEA